MEYLKQVLLVKKSTSNAVTQSQSLKCLPDRVTQKRSYLG